MNDSSSDLLNTPLENLGISSELMIFCQTHNFKYFSDLISVGTRSLDRKQGFTKRMLFEYLQLLEGHGLEDFMDT